MTTSSAATPSSPSSTSSTASTVSTVVSDVASTTTEVQAVLGDLETIGSGLSTAVTDIATADLWSAICGFFTALPGIISLVQSFMGWFNTLTGNTPQERIATLGQAFAQLRAATTPAQQQGADQSIANGIGDLPT